MLLSSLADFPEDFKTAAYIPEQDQLLIVSRPAPGSDQSQSGVITYGKNLGRKRSFSLAQIPF